MKVSIPLVVLGFLALGIGLVVWNKDQARDGATRLPLPDAEPAPVSDMRAGGARSETAEVELQAKSEPKIEPVMIPWNAPPPARVTLHFVHPDGSPYTDLLVTLQEDLWGTSGFPEETVRVGSEGTCDFENLEPHRPYYLMLQRGSLSPEVQQWCDDHPEAVDGIGKGIYLLHDVLTRRIPPIVLAPDEDGVRVVVIEDGVEVLGEVAYADCSPARVMLEVFPAGDEPADWHEIHSGPDGRFRIGDIAPGTYTIRANEDGASTELTIVPDRKPSWVFLELSSPGP